MVMACDFTALQKEEDSARIRSEVQLTFRFRNGRIDAALGRLCPDERFGVLGDGQVIFSGKVLEAKDSRPVSNPPQKLE